MRKGFFVFLVGGLTFAFSGVGYAVITLPALFGDHMVLQQGRAVPVWGWAEPGEKVTVEFGADAAATSAGPDGAWRVTLKPAAPPGAGTLAIKGTNSITIHDVLVGEVWLGSGQSNMAMAVKKCQNAQQEIAQAQYPQIRVFTVDLVAAETSQAKCNGKWVVCSPETAGEFSAVGYFFGRTLHQELKVPVGIINSSWGGTPCEAWTKKDVLESNKLLAKITKRAEQARLDYQTPLKAWQEEVEKAKAENKAAPDKPGEPPQLWPRWQPAALYNGMIAPLIPYAIGGVIWYQGESNADFPGEYRRMFPAMIQSWREQWGQGDFPFLFVQLASLVWHRPEDMNLAPTKGTPKDDTWAEQRESQLMTLSVSNAGMAVTIDIGDSRDIHPKNKQEVGRRLALWALAKTYNRDVVYSGPLYKSMKIEGKNVRLSFDYTDGGLEVRQANTAPADKLEGFAISGADKKYVWAEARIDGDTVVVWSDAVAEPAAVRYGWAIYPICNLFNKAGLPASPFQAQARPASPQPGP